MIQEGINTNKIYGSTKDVAKQIFEESGCEAVSEEDMEKMGTAGCNYVSVFKNQLHAEHEYAANCVPAQVCKQDVVGMTKGLVATYGVVLQILQGNLGQLAYIGEGPTEDCMEGMNKINEGKLKDVLVEKPIKFGPIVIGKKEELEFGGMLRLGIEQSLSNCQAWAARWRSACARAPLAARTITLLATSSFTRTCTGPVTRAPSTWRCLGLMGCGMNGVATCPANRLSQSTKRRKPMRGRRRLRRRKRALAKTSVTRPSAVASRRDTSRFQGRRSRRPKPPTT